MSIYIFFLWVFAAYLFGYWHHYLLTEARKSLQDRIDFEMGSHKDIQPLTTWPKK